VFWVPRRSIAVEKVLEDEGVYGSLTQVRQLQLLRFKVQARLPCMHTLECSAANLQCSKGTWLLGVCSDTRSLPACLPPGLRQSILTNTLLRCMLQGEFGLDLVPLEDDVLSLELDRAFR
jgi:hypothetical protein